MTLTSDDVPRRAGHLPEDRFVSSRDVFECPGARRGTPEADHGQKFPAFACSHHSDAWER